MLSTLAKAFKVKDIRNKILFTLFVLIIFRLGAYITVPGINAKALTSVASSGLVSILNTFSGGGLTNYSIFAMGFLHTSLLKLLSNYFKWISSPDTLNGGNKVKLGDVS